MGSFLPRLRRSVLPFALAASLATACTPQASTDEASSDKVEPLVVGTSPWPAYVGQFVAEEKGFYEEEGVVIEERNFPVTTDVNTALLAGNVDVAWVGIPDMIVMAETDPSVRLVYVSEYSDGADGIIARNDVQSPEDLIGKTIAWEELPLQSLLLESFLGDSGVTAEELDFVMMPAAEAATAFAAEKVDVAITYEPFMTAIAIENGGQVLFSSKGSNLIPGGLIGKSDRLEERREDIEGFMRAMEKGFEYADANPEEAAQIISDKVEISIDELAPMMSGLKIFRPSEHPEVIFNPENPLNIMDSIKFAADVAKEMELVDPGLEVDQLHDPSFTANF